MPPNKPRLYVSLYLREHVKIKRADQADRFHWALIVGPKKEDVSSDGWLFHYRDQLDDGQLVWKYETRAIKMLRTNRQLSRVMVGKVLDVERLKQALAALPLAGLRDCVDWVEAALTMLQESSKIIGTSKMDWQSVQEKALEYTIGKRDEGRYRAGQILTLAPTMDIISEKETVH